MRPNFLLPALPRGAGLGRRQAALIAIGDGLGDYQQATAKGRLIAEG